MSVTYVPNIRRGMKFLDEVLDEDWRSKIDLEKLDLANGHYCILGQLCGSFTSGRDYFSLDEETCIKYGFVTQGRYSVLTDRWVDLLAQSA